MSADKEYSKNKPLTKEDLDMLKLEMDALISKEEERQRGIMILNENKPIDVGFVKSGRENRRERRKNERKRK